VQNPKFLFLLLSFVLLVNYINYMLPNRDRLNREKELLERKIAKEHKLNAQHIDSKKLILPYKKYFFDEKKYNYSQAMGKFQEIITKSAQKQCKITSLKWAPVPTSQDWYDRLKINLSLECKPKNMFLFINKLRENPELFYVQNLKLFHQRNKTELRVNMQLVAYRKHHEK